MNERKQELIEYAKLHLSGLIPYNVDDYEEQLEKLAERYVDMETCPSPDFIQVDIDFSLPF